MSATENTAPSPAAPAAGERARRPASGSVTIRLAENERDIDTMVALGRMLHRESRYRNSTYDADKLRSFGRRALADKSRHGLLMAVRGEEVVGFLTATVGEYYFGRDLAATAMTFYVRTEYRGGRAAVKLLHGLRNWARNRGVHEIHINVTSGVHMARTDRLMKHLGFELLGGNYGLRLATGGAARKKGEPAR